MDQQLTLDGTVVSTGRQAPRQDAVLALLRSHPDGCSADECGAAVHASAGKHAAESVCAWCGPDSRPILLALMKKRLITRTRSGQFTLRKDEAPDGAFGDIPF